MMKHPEQPFIYPLKPTLKTFQQEFSLTFFLHDISDLVHLALRCLPVYLLARMLWVSTWGLEWIAVQIVKEWFVLLYHKSFLLKNLSV